MKKVITSTLDAYRQYRAAKAKSKAYRIFRYSVIAIFAAYFFAICFPQYLFAHEVAHKNFKVYSREPLDENIYKVLDEAETRLSKSSIYDGEISRRIFLTNSHGFYTFLSNKAFRSFANSVPVIDNILINRSDTANDLVYLNRPEHNKRSLMAALVRQSFVAVPQVKSVPLVTKATFPLVPLMAIVPVASGVGRFTVPPAPIPS